MWSPQDRLLAMGLQAYEDDLCPGCGYPRTYSMHADAKGHWQGSKPLRCYACTAIHAAESSETARKTRPGVTYVARPDEGIVHAMSDPVLTYPADEVIDATGTRLRVVSDPLVGLGEQPSDQ